MLVLGIDTSTEICSVGISNKEDFIGEINIKLKRKHSERLLPIIVRLFSETGYQLQDIDGLAVTEGPGSFTGLRIGLSTAQAFKRALNIPVYSVSSLEYMAYAVSQHYENYLLVPAIDARNKRVYTSIFESLTGQKSLNRIRDDKAVEVKSLSEILKSHKKCKVIFGSGVDSYYDILQKASLGNTKLIYKIRNFGGFNLACLGYNYLSSGKDTDYNGLVPKYLKKPQARLNWEKKYLQGD